MCSPSPIQLYGWSHVKLRSGRAREVAQWDLCTLCAVGHSLVVSHHTHLCAWSVFLQPRNAGQIMSSKLCIRSQSLPSLPQSHTHTLGYLTALSAQTEQITLTQSRKHLCHLDQQGHPLHLAWSALTEGESKFQAMYLGPSLSWTWAVPHWPGLSTQ